MTLTQRRAVVLVGAAALAVGGMASAQVRQVQMGAPLDANPQVVQGEATRRCRDMCRSTEMKWCRGMYRD